MWPRNLQLPLESPKVPSRERTHMVKIMPSERLQRSRSRVLSWRLSIRDRDNRLRHFLSSLKSNKSTLTRRARPCMVKFFPDCSLRLVKLSYQVRFSLARWPLRILAGVIARITLVHTISMLAQRIKSFNLDHNSSSPSCQHLKLPLAC